MSKYQIATKAVLAAAVIGTLAACTGGSSPHATSTSASTGDGITSLSSDVASVLPASTIEFTELNVGTLAAKPKDRLPLTSWLAGSQPFTQVFDAGLPVWAGADAAEAVLDVGNRLIPVLAAPVASETGLAKWVGTHGVARVGAWALITPLSTDGKYLTGATLTGSAARATLPAIHGQQGVIWWNLAALAAAPANTDAGVLASAITANPASLSGKTMSGTAVVTATSATITAHVHDASGAASTLGWSPSNTNLASGWAQPTGVPVLKSLPTTDASRAAFGFRGHLMKNGAISVSTPTAILTPGSVAIPKSICPATAAPTVLQVCMSGLAFSRLDYEVGTYGPKPTAPASPLTKPSSSAVSGDDYSARPLTAASPSFPAPPAHPTPTKVLHTDPVTILPNGSPSYEHPLPTTSAPAHPVHPSAGATGSGAPKPSTSGTSAAPPTTTVYFDDEITGIRWDFVSTGLTIVISFNKT